MLHVKTIHSQLYITVHICVCFIISLIHNWKCVRTWRCKIRHSLIRGMMYSKLWGSEYSNFVHRWQYINSIDNGSWRIFHKMSKLVPSLFSKHIFATLKMTKYFFIDLFDIFSKLCTVPISLYLFRVYDQDLIFCNTKLIWMALLPRKQGKYFTDSELLNRLMQILLMGHSDINVSVSKANFKN